MSAFPLPKSSLDSANLREDQIDLLEKRIERHIAEERYPGCQIAIARHGKLAYSKNFGHARAGVKVSNDTLWLLYSNTKVVTAIATWVLAERGAFRFTDKITDYIPEFARNGKQDVTVHQVITHLAGFPSAQVPQKAWEDHAILRDAVCNFALEYTPGSRLHYHGQSAHWTLAVLIEALTGQDYRTFIHDEVLKPLGLNKELYVGLPDNKHTHTADMHTPQATSHVLLPEHNTPEWKRAGSPGAGGYATARAMAALYQMMLQGGTLNGKRLLSPRTLQYAIRNWTGDMLDHNMNQPMHRGLGPHLRGTTQTIRGLGSFAHPTTFGHGGAGIAYCWGDPDSGTSFAYLTNCRIPDPWHSKRLDTVSNLVHSAIL